MLDHLSGQSLPNKLLQYIQSSLSSYLWEAAEIHLIAPGHREYVWKTCLGNPLEPFIAVELGVLIIKLKVVTESVKRLFNGETAFMFWL